MDKQQRPDRQRLYDLIVMGASAGGIEALSVLVATLPNTLRVPIVIAQHLDPSVPSHLGQILARRSKLPVRTVGEDAPEHLEDGTIYVVPADRDVEITDSTVRLRPAAGLHPTPSIDRLLSSAAHAYGERAIAIILTGSGSDGAAGARDVKAAGGTVVIENPATASYPTMPASLAPTTVDLVVDLDRMGPLITDLISGAQTLISPAAVDTLPALLEQIRQHAGIDFSQYKSPTILRRLQRRLAATGTDSLHDYNRYLELHPEEYQHLVASFLINVTEFFRDQALFNFMREQILPDVIAHARERHNEIRVWSAGCATGEEPYSIAILLAEALGTEALQFNIRIFATDVDADAVAFARRGHYGPAAVTSVPEQLRNRYFSAIDGGFEIAKSIRNMVIFGEHDLGQRAPFPHMDMVICRNVLIYFTTELQQRSLQLFAFSLRDGGFLVLGNAESATMLSGHFALVHPHYKVYRRQGDRVLAPPMPLGGRNTYETAPILAEVPPGTPPQGGMRAVRNGEQLENGGDAEREPLYTREIGQRLYTSRERFADQILSLPIGVVVVDRNYDVLTINSTAYALLDIHRPAISKDLLHLAERIPTRPLRKAIDGVFQTTTLHAAVSSAVTIQLDVEQTEIENKRTLQITCYPYLRSNVMPDGSASPTVEAVILFIAEIPNVESPPDTAGERASTPDGERASSTQHETEQEEAVRRLARQLEAERALNHELRVANQELREESENLRRSNEDLLVNQEEVQASSEETKTLNEEMQATNEELETLNEELEATVEELHTTNDDLLARTQELQSLAQEKEEAHQASERERAQLAAILSSMGDAVLVVDMEEKPVLTNAAYQRMFGDAAPTLAIEDEAGVPLPPEAAPWRRAGEGVPFTMTFIVREPDGTRRGFEANGQPVYLGERQIGGVVAIRDISDRSLRGLYERFLGQVSHELSIPLAALSATLQLLVRQLPQKGDARLRTLATNAQRHSRQLAILVGDLSDLERVQHDKLQLALQPVDVIALVRRAADDLELVRPLSQGRPPVVVRTEPKDEPLLVMGDTSRLEQILRNVLTNAVKYAPKSERIDVRVRRVREQSAPEVAEIEVQDYGPGIPAADLPFLFIPFYQAVNRDTSHQGGLGLGLYIVQQLAEAHGGQVGIRSPEGQGTTVTIRIPVLKEEDQPTAVGRQPSEFADTNSQGHPDPESPST